MQNIGWYVRRIRSMGPREVVWRVRSLLRDYGDIVRAKTGLYPKLDTSRLPLLEKFRPGFRFDVHGEEGIPLRQPVAAWRDRLLTKADSILEDKLSYFDLEEQWLGNPIQWHSDLSAGKSGPIRHRTFVDYRNFETYGDCKLVWEPNRHHQLVVLARSCKVTGDDRYAAKAAALIRDWCQANRFGFGMNWKSPMEVAIRNINWIFALDLLLDSGALDRNTFERVVHTVYVGTWDTVRRLSQGSSSNNHLIGEAAGVFIAASYFPEFPEAAAWREKSQDILEAEIIRQSYDDGCTREHAFGYMFFVTQFFTLSLLAAERSGTRFSSGFRNRLKRMYGFLAEICSDSRRLPAFGDADDGYVVDLGELPGQPSELVTVGADLFDDESLRFVTETETSFWLFGATPARAAHRPRNTQSVAFMDAGYFLLRSGGRRENEMAVLFDCAELGFGAIAAHGHADCLSFVLTLGEHEVFVDPGTFDYFTYPEWRNYFRSTRAHNTVTIDDVDQSEMSGPFMWGKRAKARVISWEDTDESVAVVGEHDGYQRLSSPVVHRRALCLNKSSIVLDVTDHIISDGVHVVARHFHLAPGWQVTSPGADCVEMVRGDLRLILEVPGSTVDAIAATDGQYEGWVSDGYHRRSASTCLRIVDETRGTAKLRTRIRNVS